jgi:glycosyltransferase involved in cell wall biosynthesis
LISRLFRSAVFVAVSHDLARQWRRYTGECDIIYNGIDTERWVYRASAAPKTAIWSGRIVPEKAPHLAIRAAVKAGYRLSIAGPLTDPTYFGKYIEPYLSEEVRYIGHLDQQSLSSHIAAASVGLYTSVWREPFGLVLPEMLACGTPIAGFATGAAPELLSAQVSKLVDAEDLTALAAAIHEASALSRPGCRAYAEKSFSLSTMLLAYEKLYYSLF